MTLLPSLFLSLFPSNAASMPESPPIEEVHRVEPHMLSSDDEPETGGQSGSEPLVTGPTIHHCNIGMVVIEHQQCHLLHNQLFHPPDDDLNSGNLKNVKKRLASSDADGQPASQAARLQGGSAAAAPKAARPTAPDAQAAPDAQVAPENQH